MNPVDVTKLNLNQSTLAEKSSGDGAQTNGRTARQWPRTPFPINPEINERVVLYDGDIELLKADAIVSPTNENLTQLSFVSKLAGPELANHIKRQSRLCATGDVRLTPGFQSNFKHIIHAVPPRYQTKYRTAAETALFHTYFRILEIMIEKKIRTVVMPLLSTNKCNLPFEDNFHMQLRVVRRMLEKKLAHFDRIVIYVQACEDPGKYAPFFYYFPRSSQDEEMACYQLGPSVGGSNGEPVIPGREIRIIGKPAGASVASFNDHSIDLISGLDLSTVVGKTAFSKMRDELNNRRHTSTSCSKDRSNSNQVMRSSVNQFLARKSVFKGCNLL